MHTALSSVTSTRGEKAVMGAGETAHWAKHSCRDLHQVKLRHSVTPAGRR